jgi:LysM repeat protein
LAESTDTSGVTCDSVKYTIMPGDTVGGIARRFGVSVESILKANKLSASSMIYAGRTLIIPNPQKLVDDCVVYARLTPAMRHNARIIIDVGRSAGIGDYGLVIALAAAAQESGLRNIDYGDRDSLGLFQQRPSAGWGTPDEILDQRHASSAFFGGAINPNPGRTRGLLDIDGWRNMSVTKAAQAVQLSARPRAYAKWEASARHWLSKLG